MEARPWVLTCDPGVDDAIALAVLAGRPDCRLRAVVAGAGNVPAALAWRNAAGMAALLGLDAPVGLGGAAATDGSPIRRDGARHGDDGLAGCADRLPAAPAPAADGLPMIRGDVLATGPLTDVARALAADRPVRRVVWMGGVTDEVAPDGPGEGGEFNAAADPGAVDAVLAAPLEVRVVPIEITRQVTLRAADLDRWSRGTRVSRFCAGLVARRTTGDGGIVIHDAVAAVAALEPDLVEWSARRLSTGGPQPGGRRAGRLTSTAGTPNALLAVAVDAPALRERIVDAVAAAPA